MADDSSNTGVLRYLEVSSQSTECDESAQLTSIVQGHSVKECIVRLLNLDIISYARSIMVSDAQKHFAKTSFPPELRLQAMRAGIPYNTTNRLADMVPWSSRTITHLRHEAHGLLLSLPREH